MGPPETLILALQERLGVQSFIETGTYRGDTAAWAARYFRKVVTAELSPDFYAAAKARFAGQPEVNVFCGSSDAILREVIPALGEPAIFWLDAHWSGLDTAGRESECPLLMEIAAVNASPLPHIVLVDDARLFCAPPPSPHRARDWPDLFTVVSALREDGRRHVVLTEDVLVAVPAELRPFLTDWFQNTASLAAVGRPGRWWKKFRA